jgi:LuxR family quorum sensing-dependent transcriptional regulator
MTRRALDETLAFVAAVDRAVSPDRVAQILLSAVLPFGFSQLLAGIIPTPGMSCEQQTANVVLQSWPEQWSCRYFKQGYLFDDPTIRQVTSSIEPFLWSDLRDRGGPARRIMGEAAEFGLRSGFTVPMVTLDGQYAGLSIAGGCAELPPLQRGVVQFMATYAFARSLLLRDSVRPTLSLTVRETDVLQWIAEGKTDWEIAKILNVSEHLVDKMARQIRLKCGAVNRVQAVAFAIRAGMIR